MTDKAKQALWDNVASVLEELRPAVQGDGGDVELVDIDDDMVVHVRLHGTCVGCPSAATTLTFGVERRIKQRLPEVSHVVCT